MILPPAKLRDGNRFFGLAFLVAAVFISVPQAFPQSVRTREDIARLLTIEKLNIADGTVSGEVYNRSPSTVRDVQLFVRHTWLWDNEMKPGKEDPGTSIYYALPAEIPPGGRFPFSYKPSPPSKMAGGHFETSVAIGGFTEVIHGR